MNLKNFVSETLRQIVLGVKDISAEMKENGADINPAQNQCSWKDVKNFDQQSGLAITNVEFDVAITTQEDKKTKGGIGVVVASVVLGSQGESSKENLSVSRVKFSVPMVLPTTKPLEITKM